MAEKTHEAKLISKAEVPAFIQRRDLADQMMRWAVIEQADGGPAKYGMPFKITKDNQEDGVFGFVTSFQRTATDATDIAVRWAVSDFRASLEQVTQQYRRVLVYEKSAIP